MGVIIDPVADAVIESVNAKSEMINAGKRERRFQFKRRTKMPFRLRIALFSCIFGALLLFYLLDFFAGGTIGSIVNDWTDVIVDKGIHLFCAGMANITGSDWSGRELALSRLLLLGPISYSIVCFVASLLISGAVAIIWSCHATRHALDDGTSNFVPEKKNKGKGNKAKEATRNTSVPNMPAQEQKRVSGKGGSRTKTKKKRAGTRTSAPKEGR